MASARSDMVGRWLGDDSPRGHADLVILNGGLWVRPIAASTRYMFPVESLILCCTATPVRARLCTVASQQFTSVTFSTGATRTSQPMTCGCVIAAA